MRAARHAGPDECKDGIRALPWWGEAQPERPRAGTGSALGTSSGPAATTGRDERESPNGQGGAQAQRATAAPISAEGERPGHWRRRRLRGRWGTFSDVRMGSLGGFVGRCEADATGSDSMRPRLLRLGLVPPANLSIRLASPVRLISHLHSPWSPESPFLPPRVVSLPLPQSPAAPPRHA